MQLKMLSNSYSPNLLLGLLLLAAALFGLSPQDTSAQAFPTHSSITLTGRVQFTGNLAITGALSKGNGTFLIDHPLDPANKLLYHSFVESPEVKNIYDGIAVLDAEGEVTIWLPEYFDALNTDVRYQFFPLDEPMPGLYIKEEEHNNRFTIGGGIPYGKISWQVSGNRHDPYILANPIIPEVFKNAETEVGPGECLFEPLCEL